VINTDGHAAYPPAVAQLKAEGALEENCRHRSVQYLNNVLEQDHRAIKRPVNASQHFRSFWGAWRTIAGYEAIHMIRKGQACWSATAPGPVCCTDSFLVCLESSSDSFSYRTHLHSNSKVATLPLNEVHPSSLKHAPNPSMVCSGLSTCASTSQLLPNAGEIVS
jgi:hypothetical protein